jgi:predicted ATPase
MLKHNNIKIDVGDCDALKILGLLVIVGANGTGNTRLGIWLDLKSPLWEKSLCISAQKSLAMPSNVLMKL